MCADRPSLTASLVAAARALHTSLPAPYNVAPDAFAEKLLPFPFAFSARILRTMPGIASLVRIGLGFTLEGWSDHIALRTRAIDDLVRQALGAGIRQVVIVGAGLDSRALRMPELAAIPVFEVDHWRTHRYKASRLIEWGLNPTGVRRVAIDLESDSLTSGLIAEGFEPREASLWVCEGVTMYLEPATVARIIDEIGSIASVGSRFVVTYAPLESPSPIHFTALAHLVTTGGGEPLRSKLASGELQAMLDRAQFTVIRDEDRADWAARYLLKADHRAVFERLCVAEKRIR